MKEPSKTDENPYLALRRAKIARNETRMRELGLLKRKRSEQEPSYTATALKKATKPKKEVQAQSVRRSSRLQRTSPQSVVEEVVVAKAEQKRKQNVSTTKKKSTSANQKPQIFPAHSARSMTLNVGCLVQNLLGKPMEYTGKQFVMEESARLAVEGHDGGRISFNKYCGVQEWGNDCMFLWVNLGPPKSDVVNEFLDEGRQVTWFGGSRMHNETAAICKLKRVGSASNLLPENGIVLWCRQYIPAKKTFSSYVCMGRLSVRKRPWV